MLASLSSRSFNDMVWGLLLEGVVSCYTRPQAATCSAAPASGVLSLARNSAQG